MLSHIYELYYCTRQTRLVIKFLLTGVGYVGQGTDQSHGDERRNTADREHFIIIIVGLVGGTKRSDERIGGGRSIGIGRCSVGPTAKIALVFGDGFHGDFGLQSSRDRARQRGGAPPRGVRRCRAGRRTFGLSRTSHYSASRTRDAES